MKMKDTQSSFLRKHKVGKFGNRGIFLVAYEHAFRVNYTCDLLGVNYSVNNGLYCTKWTHLHLLFGQLLPGLKSLIMGCVLFVMIACTEKCMQ